MLWVNPFSDVARISFKASVEAVHHFAQVIAHASSRRQALHLTNDLLETLARAPSARSSGPRRAPRQKAPAQALPLDNPLPERMESQDTPPGSPQKSRGLIT
jgi:hypothetical protein